MVKVWHMLGKSTEAQTTTEYSIWLYFIFGVLVTVGFCLLFNAPFKQFVLICIIGGVGMLCFELFYANGYSMITSCFLGTCIVAVFSEIASRAGRDATTVFILPGIIPFVPGALMYRTMLGFLDGDFKSVAENGSEALIMAGSIALALALVAAFARLYLAIMRRIKALKNPE
jgi:uncharacterized membrane protein YjjB (DUF3815 family)